MTETRGIAHDTGARLQALTLVEAGFSPARVKEITGVHKSNLYRLRQKARERGYDPAISTVLKVEYVVDGPRPGRPAKVTAEVEQKILAELLTRGVNHERTTNDIAREHNVSATSVRRVRRKHKVAPKAVPQPEKVFSHYQPTR